MPYETTVRWIALGLLAIGVLWVIVAAIGLRPRAMRVRRAIRKSGHAALLCGACGHPATSLGKIDTCPECGSVYAGVGLDGRGTPSRWSPPLPLVAALLLAAWALGSIVLAPTAARWANRQSIGAPQVSSERTLVGFTLTTPGSGPAVLPSVAVEIDAVLFRPMDPAVSLVPPPLPSSTITVRTATGPGVSNAGMVWQTAWQSSPYGRIYGMGSLSAAHLFGRVAYSSSAPSPPVQPFASPWAAMFAASPPYELTIDPTNERWTLHDPAGVVLAEGTGVDASLSALFDHAGVSAMAESHGLDVARSIDTLADAIESLASATRGSTRWYMNPSVFPSMAISPATASASVHLVSQKDLGDEGGRYLYHRAAPWGLTAAIATGASLALIAILMLYLSWRTKRRPAPNPA